MEESGGHGADASRLRLRRAGRVIVLDLDGRVLLFRYDDGPPNGRHWCTPGGGLDDGEDYAAGARRELAEETGWTDVVLGDEVYQWMRTMEYADAIVRQHERLFLARLAVARRELTVGLRELLTRVPDITAGQPDRLLSSFINGIKHLPCEFSS